MTAELSPEQIVDGLRQRLQFARTGVQAALYESALALITRQQHEIARLTQMLTPAVRKRPDFYATEE